MISDEYTKRGNEELEYRQNKIEENIVILSTTLTVGRY